MTYDTVKALNAHLTLIFYEDTVMAETAGKVGEVKGGVTGQVFEVYYHDMSGVYRLTKKGDTKNDVAMRVVGSPTEAMRAAEEDVRTK